MCHLVLLILTIFCVCEKIGEGCAMHEFNNKSEADLDIGMSVKTLATTITSGDCHTMYHGFAINI